MITDPVDILLTLLETRSVAGNTGQAMDLVGKHLSGLGLEVTRTNKGSLIATVPGRGEESLLVAAHIEEVAMNVRMIHLQHGQGLARIDIGKLCIQNVKLSIANRQYRFGAENVDVVAR